MKRHITLLFSLLLVLCLSVAPSAMAASAEDEVMQVVTSFNTALNTSNFDLMSSLWWHSAKALSYEPGTGYPFLCQGWDQIAAYWKANLAPGSTNSFAQTLHHPQVTMLTNDVAVTTTYANNVNTNRKTNEQSSSQLRQTLVLQKINGKWVIVHHHASELPVE